MNKNAQNGNTACTVNGLALVSEATRSLVITLMESVNAKVDTG